eukprot:6208575-Pleurochrysis_carterae.AAC.5
MLPALPGKICTAGPAAHSLCNVLLQAVRPFAANNPFQFTQAKRQDCMRRSDLERGEGREEDLLLRRVLRDVLQLCCRKESKARNQSRKNCKRQEREASRSKERNANMANSQERAQETWEKVHQQP